jgi:hypothetical protein
MRTASVSILNGLPDQIAYVDRILATRDVGGLPAIDRTVTTATPASGGSRKHLESHGAASRRISATFWRQLNDLRTLASIGTCTDLELQRIRRWRRTASSVYIARRSLTAE